MHALILARSWVISIKISGGGGKVGLEHLSYEEKLIKLGMLPVEVEAAGPPWNSLPILKRSLKE